MTLDIRRYESLAGKVKENGVLLLTHMAATIHRNRETAGEMEAPGSIQATICSRWLEIRKEHATSGSTTAIERRCQEVMRCLCSDAPRAGLTSLRKSIK